MDAWATAQPRDTYVLWTRFSYPSSSGPIPAIAVPATVANQLISVYAILLSILVVQLWSIIVSLVVASKVRGARKSEGQAPKGPGNSEPQFSLAIPALWNKKSDPIGAMNEIGSILLGQMRTRGKRGGETNGRKESKLWLCGVVALVFVTWSGGIALRILVPPLLVLGSAAPVNGSAIYVPSIDLTEIKATSTMILEDSWAFRALGNTNITRGDVQRVNVSQEHLGDSNDGPAVRINYTYFVTGAEFGLQTCPELTLNVAGSCITDYTWLLNSTTATLGSALTIYLDQYQVFGEEVTVSLLDGPLPRPFFFVGNTESVPSNFTWAAVISSVDRTSFTAGTDPWYITSASSTIDSGDPYIVRPRRPVLSCWQDDVWSYKGYTSSVAGLDKLPGLALSNDMQDVIARLLGVPMIVEMGMLLGSSVLQSTRVLGTSINANQSNINSDFVRLVSAAFVATTNVFTDSTLYPPGSDALVANMALDDSGAVKAGVASFVVWSPEVSALSLLVLVTIPSVVVGIWLIAFVALRLPSLSSVAEFESSVLLFYLGEQGARLKREHGERAKWTFST